MANIRIEINNRNITARKKAIPEWKIAEEDKRDLLRFLDDLELGKVNKGRKISEARQLKYLDLLKPVLQFVKKPVSAWTIRDIERFEKAMSSGRLKNTRKQPYSHATMVDIRRALRIYLRWKLGATKASELADWLDTRQMNKTPDYLKESEVERLYKSCKSPRERFLIAVLFDSGARATEFHNIRFEDIELPEGKENYVQLTLKEEYSKTAGRVIRLYWRHSLEAVKDFLKDRKAAGVKSTDPVYDQTYDNSRKFMHRLGKKVLGRSLHYHLFRHSSATHYAPKLNRQELCYRYGWRFSSDMPDVYISRAGMLSKELDEKFAGTEIEDLRVRLERQQRESDIMKEWKEKTEQALERRTNINILMNELSADPKALAQIAQAIVKQGLISKFMTDSR